MVDRPPPRLWKKSHTFDPNSMSTGARGATSLRDVAWDSPPPRPERPWRNRLRPVGRSDEESGRGLLADRALRAVQADGPLPRRGPRLAPLRGQQRLLVLTAFDQTVALEPLEHLAGRGPRDAEHLRHARGERRRAAAERPVLADREGEEVDRLEVFVDGVTLRHLETILP